METIKTLVDELTTQIPAPKMLSLAICRQFVKLVRNAIDSGETVYLFGLGTFKSVPYKRTLFINPSNPAGNVIELPPRTRIRFRPSHRKPKRSQEPPA